MVWRRLRIAANTSLVALHYIIQIAQGWGDDYLHQFHIYGKDYGISYEGDIGFTDSLFRVMIDDFAFDTDDRFTYEYNFFEISWSGQFSVDGLFLMRPDLPAVERALVPDLLFACGQTGCLSA